MNYSLNSSQFFRMLQLCSTALPIGAYSYSEGLEMLTEKGIIYNGQTLYHWIEKELKYGLIRVETVILYRLYHYYQEQKFDRINSLNDWLSAMRESEELREQSLQMGKSLYQLILELDSSFPTIELNQYNYTTIFALVVSHWKIDIHLSCLGYLQSWVTNLINGGVKLIPLGQTTGQKLLLNCQELIETTVTTIPHIPDEELSCCGWGLSLASMQHETQYTRLFRS